jgi:predicted PurR-regulated permease PerM
MVDDLTRNNWIIILVIASAIVLISVTILGFMSMITNVGNNINLVVNNTSKNMTMLTKVLIEEEKSGKVELDRIVNNQTKQFVKAVGNFTNIIFNYSGQNNENLKNISKILIEIQEQLQQPQNLNLSSNSSLHFK